MGSVSCNCVLINMIIGTWRLNLTDANVIQSSLVIRNLILQFFKHQQK